MSSQRAGANNDRFLIIANRVFRLITQNTETAARLESFLSNWAARFLPDPPPFADAEISISTAIEPPEIPAAFASFELAAGGACLTDGQTYFVRYPPAVVRFAAAVPKAEIRFGAELAEIPDAVVRRAFSIAFQAALRRCGAFDLHAAALLPPDAPADGFLLAGKTESGKSTLTAALAARGWRYLSDDSVVLSIEDKLVTAQSLRRGFVLRPDAVEKLSLPATSAPAFGLTTKRRFDNGELFAAQFQNECQPRRIFFSTITGEKRTRAVKISQTEAMRQLLKICPWSAFDQPIAPRYVGVLAALSKQCDAFRLELGADLLDADAAHDFFLEVAFKLNK